MSAPRGRLRRRLAVPVAAALVAAPLTAVLGGVLGADGAMAATAATTRDGTVGTRTLAPPPPPPPGPLADEGGDDPGGPAKIAEAVGARPAPPGATGEGVDVAVVDTGVAIQPGLELGTRVVNGPDLSLDSQVPGVAVSSDGMGHGTHIASIVTGIAPRARIVNLKVGSGDGTADVSQVIAAITWVTQHAHDPGLNIRVLNLSYGTGSTQDYRADPLAFAAEAAWRKGVLVVVAGGNDGSSRPFLANPALNANLLAVGAEDTNGTAGEADDTVPAFSQKGNAQRHVDVVAPGTHVLGLRAPGGTVDRTYPGSRVGTRLTRGSGTSQAAAVVSGAAATIFSARPALTNDQVKWLLMRTADPLPRATTLTAGNGLIDVAAALKAAPTAPAPATLVAQLSNWSGNGYGSLEGSRGTAHVVLDNVSLSGEKDIFGREWQAWKIVDAIANGTAWSGGSFLGAPMTGTGWAGPSQWESRIWIGQSWTSRIWISENWSSRIWIDSSWTGSGWMGGPWANASWS